MPTSSTGTSNAASPPTLAHELVTIENELEQIPVEYQDWVLIAVTALCFWLLVLPCWCGGLPYLAARKFAGTVASGSNLLLWLLVVTVADVFLLGFTIGLMPNWDLPAYIEYFGRGTAYVRSRSEKKNKNLVAWPCEKKKS
jgi:hypothetical protein